METHISPAIILRIREYRESDLMVDFFTSDRGRLSGIAKAGRKSRKRFSNCLDHLCLTYLEYEVRPNRSLCFLHSCKLISGFGGVRADFAALSLGSYMVELTERLFPAAVASEEMFELLKQSLNALDRKGDTGTLRAVFESRAVALGGYAVDLDRCCDCGRRYTGRGGAVFVPSKGGIACLRCREESEFTPRLGVESVRLLAALQAEPSPTFVTLPSGELEEIERALRLHIEYRLGRLKTRAYLAKSSHNGF